VAMGKFGFEIHGVETRGGSCVCRIADTLTVLHACVTSPSPPPPFCSPPIRTERPHLSPSPLSPFHPSPIVELSPRIDPPAFTGASTPGLHPLSSPRILPSLLCPPLPPLPRVHIPTPPIRTPLPCPDGNHPPRACTSCRNVVK